MVFIVISSDEALLGLEELTAQQLRYFTEIDHRDHMAWLAIWKGLGTLLLGMLA